MGKNLQIMRPLADRKPNRVDFSLVLSKGQIKPKGDWCVVDSPKKRTNELTNLFLFAFLLFTANKSNSFVRFLG